MKKDGDKTTENRTHTLVTNLNAQREGWGCELHIISGAGEWRSPPSPFLPLITTVSSQPNEYQTQWPEASEKSATQTGRGSSQNLPRQTTSQWWGQPPTLNCADGVHGHKLRKKPSISGQERGPPANWGVWEGSPFFLPFVFFLSQPHPKGGLSRGSGT